MKRKIISLSAGIISVIALMSYGFQETILSKLENPNDFFVLKNFDEDNKNDSYSKHVVLSKANGKLRMVEIILGLKKDTVMKYAYDIDKDPNKAVYNMRYMAGATLPNNNTKDNSFENEVHVGMEFPLNAKVGDMLPDASIKGDWFKAGKQFIFIELIAYNRKVVAIETLDTPVGKLECYKVDFDFSTKLAFVKTVVNRSYWFNNQYGIIKTDKHKKGKYKGKSEMEEVSH